MESKDTGRVTPAKTVEQGVWLIWSPAWGPVSEHSDNTGPTPSSNWYRKLRLREAGDSPTITKQVKWQMEGPDGPRTPALLYWVVLLESHGQFQEDKDPLAIDYHSSFVLKSDFPQSSILQINILLPYSPNKPCITLRTEGILLSTWKNVWISSTGPLPWNTDSLQVTGWWKGQVPKSLPKRVSF